MIYIYIVNWLHTPRNTSGGQKPCVRKTPRGCRSGVFIAALLTSLHCITPRSCLILWPNRCLSKKYSSYSVVSSHPVQFGRGYSSARFFSILPQNPTAGDPFSRSGSASPAKARTSNWPGELELWKKMGWPQKTGVTMISPQQLGEFGDFVRMTENETNCIVKRGFKNPSSLHNQEVQPEKVINWF